MSSGHIFSLRTLITSLNYKVPQEASSGNNYIIIENFTIVEFYESSGAFSFQGKSQFLREHQDTSDY